MQRDVIQTDKAPQAIGTYSQAVKVGDTVYFSGQIGLDPNTMCLISDDFSQQAAQVFTNLREVCIAAGGNLSDIVKLTIYLTDLTDFDALNDIMSHYMTAPYPARAAIQVSRLPKDANIEIDAIMHLS